ncbi:hypothetical protein FRP1_16755 [Pseudonocardia sp. EC080625-04]|uniref:hypothetical protein n=1 Tax=Pseudonocardia sp. EC080625-04 TaxID=1096868 RepID=UPI0006CB176E|nr:hypothetical protein [Pseudonocardia sp. EC080625-04]ALE74237.1 hypothetical protein FRP1_16755 [Pseudonocardia sp. EC080625-04]
MSTTAYQRELARQRRIDERSARYDQAQELLATFQHILDLHREEFPPAVRPLAPAPQQPDRAAIYRHFEAQALKGVGRFKRLERDQARRKAAAWADAEAARLWQEQTHAHAQAQGWLDHCWSQLCANDRDAVMETLTAAFEDNEAPSAPIGVSDDEVSLALLVPSIDEVVPERLPDVTQAGNISFRKISKKDRAAYYGTFVCGQALVTVREAFAVTPGIRSVRVVVLRAGRPDVYGQQRIECLLAVAFDRVGLAGVAWESAGAVDILNQTSHELLFQQTGPSKELMPLNLASEPGLRAVVEAIDLRDLGMDSLQSPGSAAQRVGADQLPARPSAGVTPIDQGWARARLCRAEVERILGSDGSREQLNRQLTVVIEPYMNDTKDLATAAVKQIVDTLDPRSDLARSNQVTPFLENVLSLVGQSLEQTGSRGPFEYLEQMDGVLRALENAWQAADMPSRTEPTRRQRY